MKKLTSIVLAFAVLVFSTQTPCFAAIEVNSCSTTKCCDEADEKSPDNSKSFPNQSSESRDDNCCINLVISFQDLIDINVSPSFALILTYDIHRSFLPDNHLKDFWQPPRLG